MTTQDSIETFYYAPYTEAWDAGHGWNTDDIKPAGMMVSVEDYISITYVW